LLARLAFALLVASLHGHGARALDRMKPRPQAAATRRSSKVASRSARETALSRSERRLLSAADILDSSAVPLSCGDGRRRLQPASHLGRGGDTILRRPA
jgi:hypothetical protein